MATKPAHYGTLGMTVLGHYGILAATGLPYWQVSSWQASDGLYGRIPAFDGIFWKCMAPKDGGFTCNNHGKPTIYVDPGLQACRGLMIVACILSFVALLSNMLILDCCTIFEGDAKTKKIVTIVSGICCLFASACTLAATVFYAWKVTYEYYNPYYQEREWSYQYGPCLYTAWIAMLLLIIAGSIMTFGSCRKNGQDDDFDYRYRRPSATMPDATWTSRRDERKTEYI